MQNSKHRLEHKFDRLYFHAKSKVKSEKYHKVKFHNHLKALVMQNPKFYIGSNFYNINLTDYTFMQNLR